MIGTEKNKKGVESKSLKLGGWVEGNLIQDDFLAATHSFWQGSCHLPTLNGWNDLQGHLCRE